MGLKPKSEKGFMAAVVRLARLCRWRVYHTHDSRHSASGFPDLVLVRPPRVVWAELKMPGRRPTFEQTEWINDLLDCGGEVYVWTPDDWPAIERVLGFQGARAGGIT